MTEFMNTGNYLMRDNIMPGEHLTRYDSDIDPICNIALKKIKDQCYNFDNATLVLLKISAPYKSRNELRGVLLAYEYTFAITEPRPLES